MHPFNYSAHRTLSAVATALAITLIAPQAVLADIGTNTAFGTGALPSQTSAGSNAAFGDSALHSQPEGGDNTAIGANALLNNAGFNEGTAIGVNALISNTTGGNNTAVGVNALNSTTTGGANTAIGVNALISNTTGGDNTAIGVNTLFNNNVDNNTATGHAALFSNTSGDRNVASGSAALYSNDSGWGNTAIGASALDNNVVGHNNIAIGIHAATNINGSNNIHITNDGVSGDNNTMRIGDGQNRAFMTGVSGIRASGGVALYINSAGQLGTTTSSERFKENIKSIDSVSDKLLQLRPVSFIYKEDDKNELQYGLIAEEVAKVYPELVQYDQEGKPFTVYYQFLAPLLLSEMQKQHAVNDAQQATLQTEQAKFDASQPELANLQQRLSVEGTEMLATLKQQQQQQQQQHATAMGALEEKLNRLGDLLQASSANRSTSERVALAPSH